MRKHIGQRTAAVFMAVITIGSTLQIPEGIVYAGETESDISEDESAVEQAVISGNSIASDDDKDTVYIQAEERKDESRKTMHINQMTVEDWKIYLQGEKDDDCEYDTDKPVVLAEDLELSLFVSWGDAPDTMQSPCEGSLTWSILRGETGTEPGSTNITEGEDDWQEFEEILSAPYFEISEMEEDEIGYEDISGPVLQVSAKDTGEDEDSGYDYYIRATFCYRQSQEEYMAITTIQVVLPDLVTEEAAMTETDEVVVEEIEETAGTESGAAEAEETEKMSETDEMTDEVPEAQDDEEEKGIASAEDGTSVMVFEEGVTVDSKLDGARETDEENNDKSIEKEKNAIDLADGVWIAGFEKAGEALAYTGNKVTQNLRIYHNGTLLTENKDYRLNYKNNINAATYDSSNAPSVTITMKGQYSGSRTLYYTIEPRDIDEDSSQGYEQVIQYSKNITIPEPTVYCGNRKLVSGKDFVCDYRTLPENYTQGSSYEDGKVYKYTVKGIGNYTGTFTMQVAVVKDETFNFGTAVIAVDRKQYLYHGKALSVSDVQVTSVQLGKTALNPDFYEYAVCAEDVGTGYVEVYPSDAGRDAGYRGFKKISIRVVGDRSIKDAKLGQDWLSSITFSGPAASGDGICQKTEGVLLTYSEGENMESLAEGVDYTAKYNNNKKVGTATITFTGIGRYTGTLKATYSITSNTELAVQWAKTDEDGNPAAVTYTKGGAEPQFDLVEMSSGEAVCVLKNKTDYTVKVTDNKNRGIMTCVIIGKGNYEGYHSSTKIEVVSGDIGQGTISVSDKTYSAKENAWKSTVTIRDVNGKKLTAGTDYDKTLTYNYDGMENGLPPQVGTTIHVTAKGINNYADSTITGNYHIYSSPISTLIVRIDAQEYTGEEITLSESDIHVYADQEDFKSGQEIEERCYEIVSYSNNIKSGTAKVNLRGVGSYGGVRTYTFKICKMAIPPATVIPITSFSLNTTEIEQCEGTQYQLTAENIQPANGTYDTIRWESSNQEIASVDYNGMVSLKKAGMAVITAYSNGDQTYDKCLVVVTKENDDTVPDGSYVTPQQYRDVNDEDDTAAFNRAIQKYKGKYGVLYVPAGTYYINAETGIKLASNLQMIMSPDAVIKALGNNEENYNVLLVQEVSQVTISGGKIVGERYEHTGGKGEWGHGIGIYDCSVITIKDVDISECWGDGIYIGTNRLDADQYKDSGCGVIKIQNCSLHNNRRNNMSVVCASNVEVDNCSFDCAIGTDPEYGIDIETNFPNKPCKDITISNSTFNGNGKGSIGIIAAADGVTIDSCKLNGHFINYAGNNVVIRDSVINGETDARIGVVLDNTAINDGSTEEDVLVASYSPETPLYISGDYSFDLSDLSNDGKSVLEKGVTYRFEYEVRGSGEWGIKTSQTSGYPCLPVSDQFATGIVTYQAGAAKTKLCQIMLYATDQTADMWLEIETIRIYEVR